MTVYAKNTSVSVEKSRAEIERILVRYGATGFLYGWNENRVTIAFKAKNKQVRFILILPSKDEFKYDRYRSLRTPRQIEEKWEQACREKWRALSLVIKAKLEAVESGIQGVTFETEFMPYIVLGNGKTVAEEILPQIEEMYVSGGIPQLALRSGD